MPTLLENKREREAIRVSLSTFHRDPDAVHRQVFDEGRRVLVVDQNSVVMDLLCYDAKDRPWTK